MFYTSVAQGPSIGSTRSVRLPLLLQCHVDPILSQVVMLLYSLMVAIVEIPIYNRSSQPAVPGSLDLPFIDLHVLDLLD